EFNLDIPSRATPIGVVGHAGGEAPALHSRTANTEADILTASSTTGTYNNIRAGRSSTAAAIAATCITTAGIAAASITTAGIATTSVTTASVATTAAATCADGNVGATAALIAFGCHHHVIMRA